MEKEQVILATFSLHQNETTQVAEFNLDVKGTLSRILITVQDGKISTQIDGVPLSLLDGLDISSIISLAQQVVSNGASPKETQEKSSPDEYLYSFLKKEEYFKSVILKHPEDTMLSHLYTQWSMNYQKHNYLTASRILEQAKCYVSLLEKEVN